jgi:hypothetical protein
MSAKSIGVALQLLITNGMKRNASGDDNSVEESLNTSVQTALDAIKELTSLAQTAAAAAQSLIKELEAARKGMQQVSCTIIILVFYNVLGIGRI